MQLQELGTLATAVQIDAHAVGTRADQLAPPELIAQWDMPNVANDFSFFILRHPSNVPTRQLLVSGIVDPQVLPFFMILGYKTVARLHRFNLNKVIETSVSKLDG